MQRGFQVYHEVCSACHGLKFVAYRNLAALGYPNDEIKAIAATATVHDGPNDEGDMFDRPGLPFDHITGPFANEQAAAAANGGKAPPDLSLIAKAREGGESYIYSILTGYEEPPAGVEVPDGGHYNAYFPGHIIAMPPPLSEDQVTFTDGTRGSAGSDGAGRGPVPGLGRRAQARGAQGDGDQGRPVPRRPHRPDLCAQA